MSPEYAREWRRKAEADRAAAKWALRHARRRKDQAEIACFHAEQCAEKYLKALLAQEGEAVPRTHDLWELAQKLAKFGFPSAGLKTPLRRLNLYAVEIRYPGASASISEAAGAIGSMERVVLATQRVLRKSADPRRKT